MREGILADPSGTIKMVFWKEFTKKVHQGCTYQFTNLRIKKDHINNEVRSLRVLDFTQLQQEYV